MARTMVGIIVIEYRVHKYSVHVDVSKLNSQVSRNITYICNLGYVETLKTQTSNNHTGVELVVSTAIAFLTNLVYFCEFLEQLNLD